MQHWAIRKPGRVVSAPEYHGEVAMPSSTRRDIILMMPILALSLGAIIAGVMLLSDPSTASPARTLASSERRIPGFGGCLTDQNNSMILHPGTVVNILKVSAAYNPANSRDIPYAFVEVQSGEYKGGLCWLSREGLEGNQ